ncbi:hypothetical protein EYF80_050866 [Liparis tanakae]|uniref:Uncharacterized protein n=1 Tax=Liparis tanakae TaxID=230148 RepID=A0A4Z2FCU8_9TELE|nr:hypothetical protein EYF80_050866 [Liparis tanakae]
MPVDDSSRLGMLCSVNRLSREAGRAACISSSPLTPNESTSCDSSDKSGVHVSGVHVGGVHVSGVHMNGVHVGGVHVSGVHVSGVHVSSVHVNIGCRLASVPMCKERRVFTSD